MVVSIVEINNGCIISFIFRLVNVRLKRNVLKIVCICVKWIFFSVIIIRVLLMMVIIEEIVFIIKLKMYNFSGIFGFR